MQASGLAKRMANLEPHRFQRGENHHTRRAAERAQLESEIIAELGADLTATDRLELRHAIELLTRRPRDPVDAVRRSNAGSRILAKVRARVKEREGNRPPSDAAKAARELLERLEKGNL